jgi:hypothetical protein
MELVNVLIRFNDLILKKLFSVILLRDINNVMQSTVMLRYPKKTLFCCLGETGAFSFSPWGIFQFLMTSWIVKFLRTKSLSALFVMFESK